MNRKNSNLSWKQSANKFKKLNRRSIVFALKIKQYIWFYIDFGIFD